jgi:hypothetical protein
MWRFDLAVCVCVYKLFDGMILFVSLLVCHPPVTASFYLAVAIVVGRLAIPLRIMDSDRITGVVSILNVFPPHFTLSR